MLAKLYGLFGRFKFRILVISINLLIGIVPVIMVGIILNYIFMKRVVQNAENNVDITFSRINSELNEYLESINMLSKTFFINTQITQCFEKDPELKKTESILSVRDMFRSALQSDPRIKGIITVTNSGNNIGFLNNNEDITFNEKDILTFKKEIAENPNKGVVFIISDKAGETPGCIYAVRRIKSVYNFNNIAWGIIILDESIILNIIKDALNDINMNIQISNNGVNIQIFHADHKFTKTKDELDAIYSERNKGIFTLNQQKYILKRGVINRTGWNVAALTQLDGLISEWLIVQISILVLILLILLVAVSASVLFNYMITQPMSQLVKAIKHMSKGDLKYHIDWQDKSGEFTEVIQAFNNMAKEIGDLTFGLINSQKQLYEMEINKTNSELRALQMQINSHFVSNSLNGVRGMIKGNELKLADVAIQKLVAIFRYAAKYEEGVSLAQEINCVKNYLELQEIRFINCLIYKMDFDEELSECQVLKMLFQPVIENSIMHGFKKGCRLVIKIFAYEKDGKLIVKVMDNGAGMPPGSLDDMNIKLASVDNYGNSSDSNSLGIVNVQRRIKAFFGSEYGIHVKSFKNRGTIVRYEIPLLRGNIYG